MLWVPTVPKALDALELAEVANAVANDRAFLLCCSPLCPCEGRGRVLPPPPLSLC